MDIEDLFQFLIVLLVLLSAAVGLIALQRNGRQKQDYLLGGGALIAAICGLVLCVEIFGGSSGLSEMAAFAVSGLLGMGMLMFSMGFLFDQFQSRSIRKQRERLTPKP